MKEFFVFGFDPVFLDILVSPLDANSEKITSFPALGEHITNSEIKMLPGGNGLNVAKIFSKLTNNVLFIGSFSSFFQEIIKKEAPSLYTYSTIHKDPNITVALQLKNGEIQINSVSHYFSLSDLNLQSLIYLSCSKIIPFSNIGLNKEGFHLFDFLAFFFIEMDEFLNKLNLKINKDVLYYFFTSKSIVNYIMNLSEFDLKEIDWKPLENFSTSISDKIFYFDPSAINDFLHWEWLFAFFEKFSHLPGHKIISLNKFEFRLLQKNGINFNLFLECSQNNYLIVHDSDNVSYFQFSLSSRKYIPVPPISDEKIVSSVGAGDSFLAGLLYEYSKSYDIVKACNFGIKTAQLFLLGSFF